MKIFLDNSFQVVKDSSGQVRLKETGSIVEWSEEKNYMFKISEFYQQIERWIDEKKPLFPHKSNKIALIQLNELKKKGDISISRERKRLNWGIQV